VSDLDGKVAVVTGAAGGIGKALAAALAEAGASVGVWDLDGGRAKEVAAGIGASAVGVEVSTWERIVAVNFLGTVRCCHVVVPGMVEQGGGRVVNIASDAGRVGSSGEVVYSGTKGAVIAFSKGLAREVASNGVTVNVVCPGPTDTPLLDQVADASQKLYDGLAKAVPMRRIAQPRDIAPAVVFLASDGAGYITGQTLSVSGGLTMA
jgi:2-hydroxycyclohexanecarboxyl-CoA dehydrogenase